MTETLRIAAAAVAALTAAPAAAFEAAGDRLSGFDSAVEGVGAEFAAEIALRTEIFAPLALVAVAALYVVAEGRILGGR